jgi:hypothetical protein
MWLIRIDLGFSGNLWRLSNVSTFSGCQYCVNNGKMERFGRKKDVGKMDWSGHSKSWYINVNLTIKKCRSPLRVGLTCLMIFQKRCLAGPALETSETDFGSLSAFAVSYSMHKDRFADLGIDQQQSLSSRFWQPDIRRYISGSHAGIWDRRTLAQGQLKFSRITRLGSSEPREKGASRSWLPVGRSSDWEWDLSVWKKNRKGLKIER